VRIQSVRQGTRRGLARIARDRCRRDDRRTRFEGSGLKRLIAVAFNSASQFPSSGKVLQSKRFVGPGMTAPRLPDPDCLFALSASPDGAARPTNPVTSCAESSGVDMGSNIGYNIGIDDTEAGRAAVLRARGVAAKRLRPIFIKCVMCGSLTEE
jgi:hypothetical protein